MAMGLRWKHNSPAGCCKGDHTRAENGCCWGYDSEINWLYDITEPHQCIHRAKGGHRRVALITQTIVNRNDPETRMPQNLLETICARTRQKRLKEEHPEHIIKRPNQMKNSGEGTTFSRTSTAG